MKQYLTPVMLAGELRLTKKAFAGVVIVVEGSDDKNVIESLYDERNVRVVPGNGKPTVLGAIHILNSERVRGVLAVVDADCSRFEFSVQEENVCYFDFHDLETMQLFSPALNRVISEFAQNDRLAAFCGEYGLDAVRDCLLEKGKFLGMLRNISNRDNLGLNFKDITFDVYIDKKTLGTNELAICQSIIGRTSECLLKYHLVCEQVQREAGEFAGDARELVQGHDLVNLLGVLLRHAIGSNTTNAVSENVLSRELRLAYRTAHWLSSSASKCVHKWMQANGTDPIAAMI